MEQIVEILRLRGWDVEPPRNKNAWWRIEGYPIHFDELVCLCEAGLRARDAALVDGGRRRKGAVAYTASAAGCRAVAITTREKAVEWDRFYMRTEWQKKLAARIARIIALRSGGEYHHTAMCSSDSHYVLLPESVVRVSTHDHDEWWRNTVSKIGPFTIAVKDRNEVSWAR